MPQIWPGAALLPASNLLPGRVPVVGNNSCVNAKSTLKMRLPVIGAVSLVAVRQRYLEDCLNKNAKSSYKSLAKEIWVRKLNF